MVHRFLRKSDKVVGTARLLKHMLTGQGSITVCLVNRSRGAPPKHYHEQPHKRQPDDPAAAEDVEGHAAAQDTSCTEPCRWLPSGTPSVLQSRLPKTVW
jgi:hypothetical protein